jgi:hypothetical protein
MHPLSPALTAMVARTARQVTLNDVVPVDAAEMERALHLALRDLAGARPRIVEFAPRVALRRASAALGQAHRVQVERELILAAAR